MEYLLEKPKMTGKFGALFKNIFAGFCNNRMLMQRIDGLQADYAMAMDQCQLMKQHILELENKISNMSAKTALAPAIKGGETPYTVAIILAKKGCGRDEIVKECGLTESEADLILTLHNKASDRSANITAVN